MSAYNEITREPNRETTREPNRETTREPNRETTREPVGEPARYAIIERDSWLAPFARDIAKRMELYRKTRDILTDGGLTSLSDFANGHGYFGFHRLPEADAGGHGNEHAAGGRGHTDGSWDAGHTGGSLENGHTNDGDGNGHANGHATVGWVYREWAPAADAIFLVGDFNGWDGASDPLARVAPGVWEIRLTGEKAASLCHLSRVKTRVLSQGVIRDRISPYIQKVVQDPHTRSFSGQIWDPPEPYEWRDAEWMDSRRNAAVRDQPTFIYEAHIGMAQMKEGIGGYAEFTNNVLPRISEAGYTAVQLMAVAEHPYYASFGYQVSNFFAPSSWFGTPDELRALIDASHRAGIAVYLDIVHSHSVMNVNEGINEFDGTVWQFFHEGDRGTHNAWGTKLFNYGKHEVIHYLLSNVKYWLTDFHFDGFRFDGVTSMIYLDHGLGSSFDRYEKYFSMNTDFEALVYLQLANELVHEYRPGAVTVAEDMSGFPGMCLPVAEGGIGFDYRLSMGVPDYWIRALKNRSDEQLNMRSLWHELTTRRPGERNIGYAESHDQALVGDKTLMFWLADKEMYDSMSLDRENYKIDRAVALHKMIRFVTLTLAGEGYLNFMGNEFGHPEWVDFPREGNGWSYKYARRQWDLADRDDLRYRGLLTFDREMLRFAREHGILRADDLMNLWIEDADKRLVYRKAGLVFMFNFSPTHSAEGYELPLPHGTPVDVGYRVLFDTDRPEFGGHGRISGDTVYTTRALTQKSGNVGILIYTPARTAMVLGPTER